MNDTASPVISGGCYCGSVRYEIMGRLRGVVNCHCGQCAKLNGNFGSHSKAPKSAVTLTKDEGLSWFKISDTARRGFCHKCGSGLFWDQVEQNALGIIAGSLDGLTGLKTIGHILLTINRISMKSPIIFNSLVVRATEKSKVISCRYGTGITRTLISVLTFCPTLLTIWCVVRQPDLVKTLNVTDGIQVSRNRPLGQDI